MIISIVALVLWTHPGGLAADGCHRDSSTGTRHCHRPSVEGAVSAGGSTTPTQDQPQRLTGSEAGGSFANCSQARAAGRTNSAVSLTRCAAVKSLRNNLRPLWWPLT